MNLLFAIPTVLLHFHKEFRRTRSTTAPFRAPVLCECYLVESMSTQTAVHEIAWRAVQTHKFPNLLRFDFVLKYLLY